MAPFVEFDHVQLAMPAGEEGRARAFYTGVLGMLEEPKPRELQSRGGVWFIGGRVRLHLGVDPQFRPAEKAHPALRCRDYASLLGQLEKQGVRIEAAPNLEGGGEHCYIHDPFGNRIELLK